MKRYYIVLIAVVAMLTACSEKVVTERGTWARGADVSWLSEMEHDGVLFRHADGQEDDCMAVMQALGMNAVRLRVWVNHSTGWSNMPDMIGLARRVHERGMRLMVDIHYSDFFADPSHQSIPEAWVDYDYEQLCQAVSDHTTEVLGALKAEGIEPEWVQVGNETPNGMLWPVGELVDKDDNTSGCWTRYAGLTRAGYEAAKQVFPNICVIVHVDNAYEQRDWFWQAMHDNGGKWDMIGLSHYPMMSAWNGGKTWQEMNDLAETNIRSLISRWRCPVMIAEVGTFAGESLSDTVMTDFVERIEAIDSCAGIFYWEPQCYGGWRPAEYIPLGWGSYSMGAFTDDGRAAEPLRIMLQSENTNYHY